MVILHTLQGCFVLVESSVASVEELLQQRNLMLQLAKESLELAQERMKVYVDKGRTDRQFDVED